jgi:hypothetical protein
MNPKRIIIIGSMVFALTMGTGVWSDEASASPLEEYGAYDIKEPEPPAPSVNVVMNDDLIEVLGVSSDEEIYDALYSGKSLAEIASANHMDVQNVIDLQIAQLTEQLNTRLASGNLSFDQYQAHKSELMEIITKSAYGHKNMN